MFHPTEMVRHSLDSVNEFARQGYNLRITCNGCGRVIEASAVLMMQELAQRGAPLCIARLEQRVRCLECRDKGETITACEISF